MAYGTESGGALCESAEIKQFMDSDEAIKIARKNGITQPKVTMLVSSSLSGDGALWTVMDGSGTKSGDVLLDFDAMTRKIVSTTKQR
jgi:hypothetical protein